MDIFEIASLEYALEECPLITDFNKVCRVCLSRCSLHSMFKYRDDLVQYPQDLSFIITQCLGNNVQEDDGLPDKVCERCINILKLILHIRNLSEDSDNRLKYALKQEQEDSPTDGKALLYKSIPCEFKCELDKLEFEEIEPDGGEFLDDETDASEVNDSYGMKDNLNTLGVVNAHDTFETDATTLNRIANGNNVHVFRCKVCHLDFKDARDKIIHEKNCCWTGLGYPTSEQDEMNYVSPLDDEMHRIYGCTICRKVFDMRDQLKRHLATHLKNRTGTLCFVCGKAYASQYLTSHLMTHGERSLACEQCKYRTNNPQNLVLHKRTHSGDRPYKCDRCLYQSVNMSNLRKHQITHTGERNFACSECENKYTTKRSLINHITAIHLKLRPFLCQECEGTFTSKSGLRKHMKQVHKQKNKKKS